MFMKKYRLIILSCLSVVFFFIIFSQAWADPISINEDFNGKEITVYTGQTMELVLPGNPTTGYTWRYVYEPDKNLMTETGNSYKIESDLIGAGGNFHWTYSFLHSGSASLSLEYCRPWENNSAIKTFDLKINIVDNPVNQDIIVKINDKEISFPEVKPLKQNDEILVPLRYIGESLGAGIKWEGENQTVEIKQNNDTIILQIGSKTAAINGRQKTLDTAPIIISQRTYLPLRLLPDIFAVKVTWDSAAQTAALVNK